MPPNAAKTPGPDDVDVYIDKKKYRYWDNIEIHLSLDNHATVGFTVPFEPDNKDFRDTFRPFSFKPLEVYIGGNLIFTGTLVDVNPRSEAGAGTVDITAYSRPAVLADSDGTARQVPTEFSGFNLRQIAEQLCDEFKIKVVARDVQGAKFKKVKLGTGSKIQDFLSDLAQQRGSVISSTEKGELLIWKSVEPGHPVAKLEEGERGCISVVPTFSPQDYYSEITGYVATRRGKKGSIYTAVNTRLAGGALRASAFNLDSIEKGDAKAAVDAKMGRMFANVMHVVVEIPSWNDPQGRRWKPNTTFTLKAPSAMIYSSYEFLVRDVFLLQQARTMTAKLGLVMPGAFSGQIPKSLPWED